MTKNKKKNSSVNDYIDFLETVGKSKRVSRSGWLREKVKNPESVAEHSFRVGIMAMVMSGDLGEEIDGNKLIKMALLHDIGEVVTGDIVTERYDVIDVRKRDEKEKLEREGIRKIFDKIGKGHEYVAIFDEMIAKDTSEAKVFWQLDKLEMALQAYEYEKEQGLDLKEFFVTARMYSLENPILGEILEALMRKRKE